MNEFTDATVKAYLEAIERARYNDQHSLMVQLHADLADYKRTYGIEETNEGSDQHESGSGSLAEGHPSDDPGSA